MRANTTTLRVYDSGKEGYVDRYSLFYPTPKSKSTKGVIWDFSFNDTKVITCCHYDIGLDFPIRLLGKKVKIDDLPKHVQEWIAKEQAQWDENPDLNYF